jgi:drug/metabolite transporter (DMT)-like permease
VQGTYYFAIATLGVGLAILMQYVAPALIIGFQALRGHRVGPRVIVAVVAALTGTGLLVGGLGKSVLHVPARGWVAGAGAALSFAFYILYSKRGLARYAPETVLFYTFTIAAAFWSLIMPLPRILAQGYGLDLWLMFLALGVFSTLVPFACFYTGLRHLPAAEAAIVATMEPVVAVVSAALILGEGLRGVQWAGAAMVLAAAVLSSLESPAQGTSAAASNGGS